MGVRLIDVCLIGMHLMDLCLMGVSHGRVPMGVHIMGVHLVGVYLLGMHLMGAYLMGVYFLENSLGCVFCGDYAKSGLRQRVYFVGSFSASRRIPFILE